LYTIVQLSQHSINFTAKYILYDIILLIVLCICFVGLCKLKPYGWYSYLAIGAVDFIYYTYQFYTYKEYNQTTNALSSAVSVIVKLIMICYYYRRKVLFFTANQTVTNNNDNINYFKNPPLHNSTQNNNVEALNKPLENTIKFCRKCGNKLFEDSEFCSYCGTKVK